MSEALIKRKGDELGVFCNWFKMKGEVVCDEARRGL